MKLIMKKGRSAEEMISFRSLYGIPLFENPRHLLSFPWFMQSMNKVSAQRKWLNEVRREFLFMKWKDNSHQETKKEEGSKLFRIPLLSFLWLRVELFHSYDSGNSERKRGYPLRFIHLLSFSDSDLWTSRVNSHNQFLSCWDFPVDE